MLRAYSTKAAREDVHAMMMRGFAAAAEREDLNPSIEAHRRLIAR